MKTFLVCLLIAAVSAQPQQVGIQGSLQPNFAQGQPAQLIGPPGSPLNGVGVQVFQAQLLPGSSLPQFPQAPQGSFAPPPQGLGGFQGFSQPLSADQAAQRFASPPGILPSGFNQFPQAPGILPPPGPGPLGPAPGGFGAPLDFIVSGAGRNPLLPRRNSVSEGQCNFDNNCWNSQPNCAIANGVMFERKTAMEDCEECLAACLSAQSPNSPYICRAVTYDHRWKICDLFAVSGNDPPQFLTDYKGRDLFRPTNNAGCNGAVASTVGPTPSGDVCDTPVNGEAQIARFCHWDNSELIGNDDFPVPTAADEASCASACQQNQPGSCASFDFTPGTCILSQSKVDAAHPKGPKPGSGYYEKVCMPASLAQTTDLIWDAVDNMILVGHVQEVVDAKSLVECKIACLQAQQRFSFECKSGMYYPDDPNQNCLLNTATRISDPEVFVPETQAQMVYFDVGRGPAAGAVAPTPVDGGATAPVDAGAAPTGDLGAGNGLAPQAKRLRFNRRFQDANGATESRWTQWSNCTRSLTGYSHRYLSCKQKDIRKCPKQTKECVDKEARVSSLAQQLREQTQNRTVGVCEAVRDHRGDKRCPHGSLLLSTGERQYCRNPVDCP